MRGHVQKISLCSFLSYLRCFQFPFLSSRERPWTLCLISYSYANWPPSGHGENKGTVFFRGGAVDFMILNVHPSIQSFPSTNFRVLIPRLRWKRWIFSSSNLDHPFTTQSESETSLRSRDSVFRVQVLPFPPLKSFLWTTLSVKCFLALLIEKIMPIDWHLTIRQGHFLPTFETLCLLFMSSSFNSCILIGEGVQNIHHGTLRLFHSNTYHAIWPKKSGCKKSDSPLKVCWPLVLFIIRSFCACRAELWPDS